MERLIEYVTAHPLLAGAVVLALVIVITNESRLRATAFAAISSQELIRLMNQGALVLDIRKPEQFALGHVTGAKQLPSDQILTAGDSYKRFKEKPVVYIVTGAVGVAVIGSDPPWSCRVGPPPERVAVVSLGERSVPGDASRCRRCRLGG